MKIGQAVVIFENIDRDEFTDEEKAIAIHMVMEMPTHNSIPKRVIIKALQWLWHYIWEWDDDNKEVSSDEPAD